MMNLFITEDQEMYLEGLTLLLRRKNDISITGTAANGNELLARLPSLHDDILLLDVHLPDMDEETLLKEIRAVNPSQKIIYLTLMRGTRFIHKLMKHSIQGYVLKNAPLEELYEAIKIVYEGGTYFSKEIDIISDNDFRSTITVDESKVNQILSKREIEVLKLVCKEYSNSDIAEKLFLSVSTVETHRKNLIAKLGVHNTVGLVKYALKNNLID
jgi:DNA-binding NarL/FixJ family response regulator